MTARQPFKTPTTSSHFYPTQPHALTKGRPPSTPPSAAPPSGAGASSSSALFLEPGPPGETPLQKVERLRNAVRRQREAQVPLMDRIVVRGRAVADTLHRATVVGLLGVTGEFEFGGVLFCVGLRAWGLGCGSSVGMCLGEGLIGLDWIELDSC